jgi:glycosyltransferase involved in cell wall biosynthesis
VEGSTPGRVVVVMPARNEAESIGPVIETVKRLHPDLDVLVVDDASTDETSRVARRAGAKVLRAPISLGYGGAVQTGLKYAHRRHYSVVVLMDADGQHDPAYVGRLLEASRDYDLVIGSRFKDEPSYRIPFVRRVGMRVFSAMASALTGQRIRDTSSGFQAIRSNVVALFARGVYPVDFPDADMIIWVARHGYRVGEVGVRMHPRVAGRSMISGLGTSLKYALKMPLAILVTVLRIPYPDRGEGPR